MNNIKIDFKKLPVVLHFGNAFQKLTLSDEVTDYFMFNYLEISWHVEKKRYLVEFSSTRAGMGKHFSFVDLLSIKHLLETKTNIDAEILG